MKALDRLLYLVLEDEEDEGGDETIKDILGPNYMEPEPPEHLPGEVHRHDRWCDVEIGNDHFCISYLTPVAVFQQGQGMRITDRNWSHATCNHIKKWMDHIGFGDTRQPWAQLRAKYPSIPQEELIDLFRQQASKVKWTKRQARKQAAVPYNRIINGLKSARSDRVEIEPHND